MILATPAAVAAMAACASPLSPATGRPGAPINQPAAPTAHALSVDGSTYAYLKHGSGPALVIVHGVGGHQEDWRSW